MHYRPEIDGLRTIAVLSVLFYHAGLTAWNTPIFSGGYIGVDVFFVISGYLIGFIVLKAIQENRFSFLDFYERRARRILPALFAVCLFTVPFSLYLMLPLALKEYGGSLFSTSLFGSNIFFLFQDSYESEASALKPLLHTWSLSVEEQFYLFFPPLILATYIYARKFIKHVLVLGFILSLIAAQAVSKSHPDLAFMLIFTRGWELLAGVLLAYYELTRKASPSSRILPIIGAGLVMGAIFIMDHDTQHPSLITALPVIGTVLIIHFARGQDLISKILMSRFFVFTGLISYSLYLWHQPVFAFLRLNQDEPLSLVQKVFALLVSYGLAVLSYYFIEQPFRQKNTIGKKALWSFSIVGTLAFTALGLWLYNTPVTIDEASPIKRAIQQAQIIHGNALERNGQNCSSLEPGQTPCTFDFNTLNPFPQIENSQDLGIAVSLSKPLTSSTWITIGDSHLKTLHIPLYEQLLSQKETNGLTFLPLAGNSCMYILGLEMLNAKFPCLEGYNTARRKFILGAKNPIVLFGGRLPLYISTQRFDNQDGGVERGEPTTEITVTSTKTKASLEDIKDHTVKTIQELLNNDVKVVLIYPIPEVGWNVPKTLLKQFNNGAQTLKTISTQYSVFQERMQQSYEVYDAIPDHPNLLRIYPEHYFCNTQIKGQCVANIGTDIYYRDDDHLSLAGGRILMQHILKAANEYWRGQP